MTERQSLLAVFALVYLSECLVWVRRGGVVFRRGFGRWAVRVESEGVRNDRGDLHWTWPLPPFGQVAVAHGLPITIGPQGVLNSTAEAFHPAGRPLGSPSFLRWEEIRSVETSAKLLKLNDFVFWKGDTAQESLRLGRAVQALRKCEPDQREARIQETVAAAFDLPRIRARIAAADIATRPVRILSGILAALLFGIAPAAIAKFGWFPPLYFLVPAMFALTGTIAWKAVQAHRGLYPEATEERFRMAFMMVLSPAAAIRAVDPLQRPLLEEFHPVAVAAVLLEAPAFAAFAAPAWRDLRSPRLPECPVEGEAARQNERWFREQVLEAFRTTIKSAGLDSDAWEKAPESTDPSHSQYCARCLSQFTQTASVCRECGGRALIPIS